MGIFPRPHHYCLAYYSLIGFVLMGIVQIKYIIIIYDNNTTNISSLVYELIELVSNTLIIEIGILCIIPAKIL